jgi:hypothetical protein
MAALTTLFAEALFDSSGTGYHIFYPEIAGAWATIAMWEGETFLYEIPDIAGRWGGEFDFPFATVDGNTQTFRMGNGDWAGGVALTPAQAFNWR